MNAGHGCDIVDASAGQVSPPDTPAYGRIYQTPFADDPQRGRHSDDRGWRDLERRRREHDRLSGRADLCALARPHLYDPHLTLHAAAEQDYDLVERAPRAPVGSRKPPAGRDRVRPELERAFEEVELPVPP